MGSANYSNCRSLDDLDWQLIQESDQKLLNCSPDQILETIESWRAPADNPLLILTQSVSSQKNITRILLFCPQQKKQLLNEVSSNLSTTAFSYDIYSHPDNGTANTFSLFSATVKPETKPAEIDALIAHIFSLFLITGRPLDHYNCTFFLPLDLRQDSELEIEASDLFTVSNNPKIEPYRVIRPQSLLDNKTAKTEDVFHAQAYEYFCPELREQLFEVESDDKQAARQLLEPIKHYRIKKEHLANWHLDLVDIDIDREDNDKCTDGQIISAAVTDVSLYRYYNGLFLLGLRVELPGKDKTVAENKVAPLGEKIDWWHPLVFEDDQYFESLKQKQVEYWLRYTKLTRQLYASFREQKNEKKIAVTRLWDGKTELAKMSIKSTFSEIVIYLLRQFLEFPADSLARIDRLNQIADDRMFVHVAYGLSGQAPKRDTATMQEFERLFSYALYVDQRSDGDFTPDQWAYDQRYIRKLMQQQMLSRWQGVNSLSGFTDYSSVFMGHGRFYNNVIAPIHAPYIYAKLQIPILFYRSTLNYFDRRITLATNDLTKNTYQSKAFQKLRKDFIVFTNKYWFRCLTPQIQGEEISRRMMAEQRLDEQYELVKDEMERADEYTALVRDQWFQQRADIAGRLAAMLAFAALVLPVWMDFFKDKWSSTLFVVSAICASFAIFLHWRKDAD